ncbi:type VII secretion protein EccE [Dactylosporangium sp. McL0621]|uniref:type VII secretion protein EccE n=1 Tax=Dactylosporangium sp. McL0621 TaxID=3415678 RepID=UPI003CEEE590
MAVQAYEAGARPRRSGGRLRIGRGRLLALEAAVGAAVAGGALLGVGGWTLVGVAVVVLAVALARRDRRWLTDLLAARVRRDAAASVLAAARPAAAPPVAGLTAPPPVAAPVLGGPAQLGAAARIAPRLEVAECTDRNGHPLGVAWDGQGFAAALELDTRTPVRVDLGRLAAFAADDDVPLAGVQVLIEQLGVARTNGNGAVPQARDPWPGAGIPLMRRAWVSVRYEPIWAPEAARRRGGGGADGARLAVAAALARLRVRLLGQGVSTVPMDAPSLARTLRGVGDPAPDGAVRRDAWVTGGGHHHCLGAAVASPADWLALLDAVARGPANRAVLSLAVELDGPAARTRAALRVVGADPADARQARQRLLDAGLATPLPGAQAAGVLATLPLGGGPRPLTGAIGWTSR